MLTRPTTQCYIFDLEGGVPVEANLDEWSRISLPLPEIHKLAIAPDTETLICILRNKDEERGPGLVFHAPISALAELAQNK